MPFANYKLPQGSLSPAQKEMLVSRTTDLLTSIYGDAARPHTMVLVDEVVDGGWGFASQVLTLEQLKKSQS